MATEEGAVKRQKKSVNIGTHDGTFHCDEALACFMLKQTEKFRDAGMLLLFNQNLIVHKYLEIIRTRKPDVLAQCDIVVDVGAVYDVATNRFDHHQITFTNKFDDNHKIKLSSAGLIYK